ncbi:MAG: tetratricopeptide repeat protein, partial [Polyangiaceae bacterium]
MEGSTPEPAPPPPPPAERPPSAAVSPPSDHPDDTLRSFKQKPLATTWSWIRDYFAGGDVTFGIAVVPLCFLSMALFTRHPTKTNFIFDEQEALLANPYVRSIADAHPKFRWIDAIHRDFWGLPPDRSIGSYRPIPDVIWRLLWWMGARDQTPFLHHWVNVILHGVNGALVAIIVQRTTRNRTTAWLAGAIFVATAVVTEAVSGVVGIADVLGALGVLAALCALALPLKYMPLGVLAATLFGLFSKESALCAVPLVPFCALLTARLVHREKPRGWLRAGLSFVAAMAAFLFYVEMRRRWFPAPLPAELSIEANAGKPPLQRFFAMLLRWYAQPSLPRDPLNNPLVNASGPLRVAGAMRVYLRGLGQIIFPWTLSGDYSAPQEPIPDRVFNVESVLGGILMVLPLVLGPLLGVLAWLRRRKQQRSAMPVEIVTDSVVLPPKTRDLRPLAGAAMVWVVVSFFLVSNIPVLLPTVRAERFWYFPAIGTSILLALFWSWLIEKYEKTNVKIHNVVVVVFAAFFCFQCFAARRHANDYTNDLIFWDATRHSVPRSAKAHLNYSVMQGARGNMEERLAANRVALGLAPKWPMASVYLGDTLCRMHRAQEAWPYYAQGFELAPNDQNLVALGVQCLWDEHAMGEGSKARAGLEKLAADHPGSWVAYIARDTIDNGDEHSGVDPKYRPRGYNEGPKKD